MGYRSKEQIQAELLEVALGRASKTRLMYGAALSYYQVTSYLEGLMATGLLEYEDSGRIYCTTARGCDFLRMFRQLHCLFES